MSSDSIKPDGTDGGSAETRATRPGTRPRKGKFSQPDMKGFLLVWTGSLAVVIIMVAVVANFNILKGQFKGEMAEHWNGAPPRGVALHSPVHAISSPGGAPAVSTVAGLESAYNHIAGEVTKTTVTITGIGSRNGMPYQPMGSGILLAQKHVLTNFHVIRDSASLSVTVYEPQEVTCPAEVVDIDRANDLAVLRIHSPTYFPSARLGNSKIVDAGDIVIAVGNPMGFGNTLTSGIVSEPHRTFTVGGTVYHDMIQTNADIHKGSSGGPLVNIAGEVIGVNTAVYSPGGSFTGIGFATPISRALPLLRKVGLSSTASDVKLAAAGCVTPVPSCNLAAGTAAPNGFLVAVAANTPTPGTMLVCPRCSSTRYVRCPACGQRLTLDAAGTGVVCPAGHGSAGSAHFCYNCRSPMTPNRDSPFSTAV